eukprot:1315260-Prymnesium_polylepis.1
MRPRATRAKTLGPLLLEVRRDEVLARARVVTVGRAAQLDGHPVLRKHRDVAARVARGRMVAVVRDKDAPAAALVVVVGHVDVDEA